MRISMIRRIQTYLDTNTADALTCFAEKNGLSLSTAAGDILREYFERSSSDKKSAIDAETKTYFLRIINTLNQVLMCVYDQDKTSLKAESAQECIKKITKQMKAFTEKNQTSV